MNVENAVSPTGDQLKSLLTMGGDKPIVMVNLLKFRDRAQYDDPGEPEMTGREAYDRYGRVMAPLVLAKGGKLRFSSKVDALVIGEVGELWDAVAIMEYPSRAAFLEIIGLPEVQEIGRHRKAGLAGQLLIQCSEAGA
ncbi:MAG: DUF1330 domain-containing protein [Caulobacter sp.]|jgi:uncharacterized protein (DUF1330 family)